MAVPRFIYKHLMGKIGLGVSESATPGTIAPAGTWDSSIYNLQLASFLNPFGQADPPADDKIAPGHVCYVFLFFAGASTANVRILGYHSATAGTARIVASPFLAVAVGSYAARVDNLGALWRVFMRVENAGGVNMTSVETAFAIRSD